MADINTIGQYKRQIVCGDDITQVITAPHGYIITSATVDGTPQAIPDPSELTISYVPSANSVVNVIYSCRTAEINFHFRSPYLPSLDYQLNEALVGAEVFDIISNLPLSSLSFKLANTQGALAAAPALTYAQFQTQVATAAPGSWIRLTTSSTSFQDGGVTLRALTTSTTFANSSFSETYTLTGIDQDHAWCFVDPVTNISFSSTNVAQVYAALRTQDSTTADWTSFALMDVAGLAALNAAVAALPAGTKYFIHVWCNYSGTNTTGTVTLSGNYSGITYRTLANSVGSSSNPQYRPLDKMLIQDGINDHVDMPYTAAQAYANFWWDVPFTISCVVRKTVNAGFAHILFASWGPSSSPISNDAIQFQFVQGALGIQWVNFNNSTPTSKVCSMSAFTLNKVNHIVLTNDGTGLSNSVNIYLNGGKLSGTTSAPNPTKRYASFTSGFPSTGVKILGSWGTAANYVENQASDFIYCKNYVATQQDVIDLFNVFNKSDYSQYPAALMASRQMHLPLSNASNYDVNSGQLRALDISGNNAHCNIFGQGTTPTLINAY